MLWPYSCISPLLLCVFVLAILRLYLDHISCSIISNRYVSFGAISLMHAYLQWVLWSVFDWSDLLFKHTDVRTR